jgi:hypothetical protein
VNVDESNGEHDWHTFLEGINKDAPGLGRGGGLSFFFGRGSCSCAGKPFGFAVDCPFVCGRGTGFSVLVVDVVVVAVPSVPCTDNESVELTRLIGGFITSLGLTSSGT